MLLSNMFAHLKRGDVATCHVNQSTKHNKNQHHISSLHGFSAYDSKVKSRIPGTFTIINPTGKPSVFLFQHVLCHPKSTQSIHLSKV